MDGAKPKNADFFPYGAAVGKNGSTTPAGDLVIEENYEDDDDEEEEFTDDDPNSVDDDDDFDDDGDEGDDEEDSSAVLAIDCDDAQTSSSQDDQQSAASQRTAVESQEAVDNEKAACATDEVNGPSEQGGSYSRPRSSRNATAAADAAVTAPFTMETFRDDFLGMQKNLTYLTHQVHRMLLALHVPPCTCVDCSNIHSAQNELVLKQAQANDAAAAAGEQVASSTDDNAKGNDMKCISSQFHSGVGKEQSQLSSPRSWNSPGHQRYGGGSGSSRGRRPSKYCSADEKRMVADYASKHGATAAARKFGVSPAVACYYHKRFYVTPLPRGRRPHVSSAGESPPQPNEQPPPPIAVENVENIKVEFDDQNGAGAATTNGDDRDDVMAELVDNSNVHSPFNSGYGIGEQQNGSRVCLQQSAETEFVSVSGGESGPIAFAGGPQGKTRGRPKLIGDQLDHDLIQYLMNRRVKMGGRCFYNVAEILPPATQFIRQNAPGLLLEDGGPVLLKSSWATNLLRRVNSVPLMLTAGGFASNPRLHYQSATLPPPPPIQQPPNSDNVLDDFAGL